MLDTSRPVLLLVDDDPNVARLVEPFVHDHGFELVHRLGESPILDELPQLRPDVALVDVRAPEIGGLDRFRAIRDALPGCQVILTTAHATGDSAIEAVKLGALDYVGKPFDWDRMRGLLDTVRSSLTRRERLLSADSELAGQFEFNGMIGRSPVMQELFDAIRRLAPHVRTALVTGERGTGKELAARALHNLGRLRDREFAVLGDTLDEAALGRADGATLFVDDVGALPAAEQTRLSSAITDRDACVIGATTRRLRDEVAAGRFRQDLYDRLAVVEIAIPPLREHRDDIPCLTAAFVTEFARRFDKAIAGVSPGAERLLQHAPWPGNVRQLRETLERSCRTCESRLLTERDVMTAFNGGQLAAVRSALSAARTGAAPERPELTRDQVEQALQQVGGNRSATARILGISRRALYRRLDSFNLR